MSERARGRPEFVLWAVVVIPQTSEDDDVRKRPPQFGKDDVSNRDGVLAVGEVMRHKVT